MKRSQQSSIRTLGLMTLIFGMGITSLAAAQTYCTLIKEGDDIPPANVYGHVTITRQVRVNNAGTWVACVHTNLGYEILLKDRAVLLATDPVGGLSQFDFFDSFFLNNNGDVAISATPHSSMIQFGGLFLNSTLVEQAGDPTAGSVYSTHNPGCTMSTYLRSTGPGFYPRLNDSGTILDRCIVTCGQAIETTLAGLGAQSVIALVGDSAAGTGTPGESIGALTPGRAFAFNNPGNALYVAGLTGNVNFNAAIYLDSSLEIRKGDSVAFDLSSTWNEFSGALPADLNDNGDFTFLGGTTSSPAQYKVAVSISGTLSKVVQQSDAAPSNTFLGFGPNLVIDNSGQVFFHGVWSGGSGFFLHTAPTTNMMLVQTAVTVIDDSTLTAINATQDDESLMSKDGRFVIFKGRITSDPSTNRVFLRDQVSPATTFCLPNQGGVIACPCGNPALGNGGCDNSSNTGGAELSETGSPSLSTDTVQLTCIKEKPTATSIFLQGTSVVSGGVAFGQGVRCVGGSLKRLYVKNAIGGVVTAPSVGDPSIHDRSSSLGDTITPGNARYYQIYYRDPTVLGGCPGTSTFNVSQAVSLTWSL